jgi:hypothetical protein
VFCDDLSFDGNDASYKSLKAVLEGGIEGRPDNVILYATSNRRHLLAREMIENERSTAINPGEAVEEKVSLSDRFGLWLGFHRCSQDEYLAMVRGYCGHFDIKMVDEELEREALEWSTTRGLAVHAGTGGTAGRKAIGEVGAVASLPLIVVPREGGGPSTPRLHGSIASALEYWIARSSAQLRTRRATTVVLVDLVSGCYRLTPRSGIEAGQPEKILCGSRSGAAATPPRPIDPTWQ